MTLARPYMGLLGGKAILVTLVAGFCVLPSSVAFSEDTIDSRKRSSSGVSAGGFAGRSERDLDVVAHWRFQKGIAGTGASSSQLIEDSSGNNHHGRAVGGPRFHSVELPSTNLAPAFMVMMTALPWPTHVIFSLQKASPLKRGSRWRFIRRVLRN